jgi:CubicO group peptidase (beta-lactamase class C family)
VSSTAIAAQGLLRDIYRAAMPAVDALDLAAATPVCHSLFAERAVRERLPSLAWGLVDDGVVVGGDGVDSAYRIASMTKSFTAAIVLMLRDEGRLRLDDVVVEHAPELSALHCPMPDAPPITVRHLLSMSAGLANDDAWADRHLDITDAELDTLVGSGVAFAALPGTTFEYSNLGYAVLGRVVRNVAGESLQELVTDRLLRPIGMESTTWTEPADAVTVSAAAGRTPRCFGRSRASATAPWHRWAGSSRRSATSLGGSASWRPPSASRRRTRTSSHRQRAARCNRSHVPSPPPSPRTPDNGRRGPGAMASGSTSSRIPCSGRS